jgi:type IV fimbrial biogenesis protein FimT
MDVDKHPWRAPARGLTLMELLATLALLVISLSLIVPGWAMLSERSQLTTAANRLLGNLAYARSAAVNRAQTVSVCPSVDGVECSGDPFGWHHGYIVFEDRDADRARTPDEALLQIVGAERPPLRLHTSSGRPAIRFQPDGAAWGTNATFRVCTGDSSESNRAVILLGTGRARVDQVAPGKRPVTCG